MLRYKWLTTLLPVMVLMAEEAAILCFSDFGGLPVMTFLAGLNARNQDVCGLFAGDRLCVARLAVNADVRVVAEYGIRQPHRFDAGGSDFRQTGKTILIDLVVLERVTLETGFVPKQIFRIIGA